MNNKTVSEDELRARLLSLGKTSDEIEKLIDDYVGIPSEPNVSSEAISNILRKAQEEGILRVGRFKLNQDEYDALHSYFEDSGKLSRDEEADGRKLVKLALQDFLELIA